MDISIHFQTIKHQKIESGDFVKGDDTIYLYTKISSLCIPLTKTERRLHLLKKVENIKPLAYNNPD